MTLGQDGLVDSLSTAPIARMKELKGKGVQKRVLNLEASIEVNDDSDIAIYGPRLHPNNAPYVSISDHSLDDTDSCATTITINTENSNSNSDEKLNLHNNNTANSTGPRPSKLEKMRKDAFEISDPFSKSLISFFENDSKFISLCAADSGEVPDKYRNYPIELCVSAHALSTSSSSIWGGSSRKYQATVEVIGMNYAWRTEVVEKSSSPAWCKHGTLPPLCMSNSQSVARNTTVFVTLWKGKGTECDKLVGEVKVRLSDLLWNGIASDFISPENDACGEIFVAADALLSSSSAGNLLMDLAMGPLEGVRPTSKTALELYRAHVNGTWIPIVRSEANAEAFKSLDVPLARIGDAERMLRLRLFHRNRNRTVSMFQFSVKQLIAISKSRNHNFLPKMRAPGDTAAAEIRVEKTFSSSDSSQQLSGRLYARLSLIDAKECPPRREVINFGPFRSTSVL